MNPPDGRNPWLLGRQGTQRSRGRTRAQSSRYRPRGRTRLMGTSTPRGVPSSISFAGASDLADGKHAAPFPSTPFPSGARRVGRHPRKYPGSRPGPAQRLACKRRSSRTRGSRVMGTGRAGFSAAREFSNAFPDQKPEASGSDCKRMRHARSPSAIRPHEGAEPAQERIKAVRLLRDSHGPLRRLPGSLPLPSPTPPMLAPPSPGAPRIPPHSCTTCAPAHPVGDVNRKYGKRVALTKGEKHRD